MSSTGRKIYHVRLEADERVMLKETVDGGRGSKERRRRAHILLPADRGREGGGRSGAGTADIPGVGTATVERARRQCVMEGLEAAPERREQRRRKPRLLDGAGEAKLVMPACPEPPEGCAGRTLKLLGERLVADSISTETVRRTLKKTISSPG